jgi:SPRY domain-containing SOCS box protein 3
MEKWQFKWKHEPQQTYNHVVVWDDNVLFHPTWSEGTVAVRGDTPLNDGCRYFWEIALSDRVFGTSMMFGIGTVNAPLFKPKYLNLLGCNSESWGLSYRGLICHNGHETLYTETIPSNQPMTIGVLFDGQFGTLKFYKNYEDLGVAFSDIPLTEPLYPMISSSAHKTEMSLQRMLKYSFTSLKAISIVKVVKQLAHPQDAFKLQIPVTLQQEIWNMMLSYRQNK